MIKGGISNTEIGEHKTYIVPVYVETNTGNQIPVIKNPTVYIETIYGQHWTRLQNFAERLGSCPEDAEEIVNTAFFKFNAYMEKHGWEDIVEKPFSFLAKTVAYLVIDRHRRKERKEPKELLSLDNEENPIEPSDYGASVKKMHRDLDDKEFFFKKMKVYMSGFSLYERKLLWLRYVEKYKPREIAEFLGQSYEKTSIDCNRVNSKLFGRVHKKARKK
ncbi:MAG TPA: sigma-70 family RNA polymerase sigma factor [Pyrinomonadaceae bacterium]|jgi:RNA polymerase sigma factor (sigma-70 family)